MFLSDLFLFFFVASTRLEDPNFPLLYTIRQYRTPFNADTSTFGEHRLASFSHDSFDCVPERRRGQAALGQILRGTEPEDSSFPGEYQLQSNVASAPTSFAFDQTRLPPSSNISATEPFLFTPQTRTHIPRPPNAFMLFRSDFLRRGIIPSHVECRQQNLSRIAGQCWNLLSPEEKGRWQDEAARVLAEHQKRNPDYKFTPAPRGTRRPKGKGRPNSDAGGGDIEDRIRTIRERYTQLAGPAAAPPRRRRPRHENRLVKGGKPEDLTVSQAAAVPHSPSMSSSPSLSSSPSSSSDCDSFLSSSSSSLQYPFRHVTPPQRPSTSLGFSTPLFLRDDTASSSGCSLARPSSAALSATDLCAPLQNLDIVCSILRLVFAFLSCSIQTPTSATFGITSPSTTMQTCPPIFAPHSNPEIYFPEALRDPLPFNALNTPPDTGSTSTPLAHDGEASCAIGGESFLSTLYADNSFPLQMPSLEPGVFSPDNEVYFPYDFPIAFDSATLDSYLWDLNPPLSNV